MIDDEVLINLFFMKKSNGFSILSKSDMEDIEVIILGDYKSILLKDLWQWTLSILLNATPTCSLIIKI